MTQLYWHFFFSRPETTFFDTLIQLLISLLLKQPYFCVTMLWVLGFSSDKLGSTSSETSFIEVIIWTGIPWLPLILCNWVLAFSDLNQSNN